MDVLNFSVNLALNCFHKVVDNEVPEKLETGRAEDEIEQWIWLRSKVKLGVFPVVYAHNTRLARAVSEAEV